MTSETFDWIPQPQNYDVVGFHGLHTIKYYRIFDIERAMEDGKVNIIATTPKMRGLGSDYVTVRNISVTRCLRYSMNMEGMRVLVVFAEIEDRGDNNRSIIDLYTKSMRNDNERLRMELLEAEKMTGIYNNFIVENGLEHNFKDRLINSLETLRVANIKTMKPTSDSPLVNVSAVSDEKK